jgi:hypothetical protein
MLTHLDNRAELIIRRPAGEVLGMAVDMLLGND